MKKHFKLEWNCRQEVPKKIYTYSSALLDLKEKKGSETEKSENLGLVVFPFLEMLAELKKKPTSIIRILTIP